MRKATRWTKHRVNKVKKWVNLCHLDCWLIRLATNERIGRKIDKFFWVLIVFAYEWEWAYTNFFQLLHESVIRCSTMGLPIKKCNF